MKQLFHIEGQPSTQPAERLLLRMGEYWAAFAYTNENASQVHELGYYTVEEWTSEELNWLHDRLFRPVNKVQIALDHCLGLLVPLGVPGSVMNMVKETSIDHMVVQEPINGWQINTVFSISPVLHKWINEKFPDAGTIHQLSAMMKFVPSSPADGSMYLDLRQKDLHLLVAAGGQLLLSQHYRYEGYEDVLYYILRACSQFGLSQEKLELKLSGLLDKQSALYKEIYQYFIQVELRQPSWELPSHELPSHYFTSLNDLFICVS